MGGQLFCSGIAAAAALVAPVRAAVTGCVCGAEVQKAFMLSRHDFISPKLYVCIIIFSFACTTPNKRKEEAELAGWHRSPAPHNEGTAPP